MKRERYTELFNAALDTNFHGPTKAELKNVLDGWLGQALTVARESGEPFSEWERIHFRDAISATYDGLFWLARAGFVKAVMPNHPPMVWPAQPEGDLAAITLESLTADAAWLQSQPAQEHPIFMRRRT